MIWYITPINDLEEHTEDSTCHCNPKVEIVEDCGDLLIIHNAFDGRK